MAQRVPLTTLLLVAAALAAAWLVLVQPHASSPATLDNDDANDSRRGVLRVTVGLSVDQVHDDDDDGAVRDVDRRMDRAFDRSWWEEAFVVNSSMALAPFMVNVRRQRTSEGDVTDVARKEMVTNVVLVKTHKTGSTTLASILFRFGATYNLKFYVTRNHHYIYPFAEYPVLPQVNISLYHHRSNQMSTRDYARWYLKIIPKAEMITILREPFSRVLSDFFFFVQPDHPGSTLESFLRNETHPITTYVHLMSKDLGIRNDDHLKMFFSHWHTYFSFFLITEQFDESLVLLKRKFNWRLEDVVYMKLLETCKQTARQWDNLKVSCPVKKNQLDAETLALLTNLIRMDIKLYDWAKERLKAELASQPSDFWIELAEFRAMQKRLNKVCEIPWKQLQDSCDHYAPHCRLFALTDLDYEKIIIANQGNLTHVDVMHAMLSDSACYGLDTNASS